jgi:RND superfamily putative drug exporter
VTLVIHDRKRTAAAPDFATRMDMVAGTVAADPILRVSGGYGWATLRGQAQAQFLGSDHRTVITSLALRLDDGAARRELPLVQARLADQFSPQGLQVSLVSPASLWGAVNTLSAEELATAEMVVLPLIAVILFLLYKSVVAAITSLTVGVTAIVLTLGTLSPIAHHWQLSIFVVNAATMLGLGVGVDYSLFVISRFQEELGRGRTVSDAVAESLRRSGHTVMFSGLTVLVTMAALLVVPLNVIVSLALGAITVVAFSILASTLVLPVLLHLIGHNINRGTLKRFGRAARGTGRWDRFARTVMRRPVLFGLLAVMALVALALPFSGLRTFSPDARIIPTSSPVRQGYDLIQQQFGVGATSPVQIVVQSSTPLSEGRAAAALLRLNDRLAALPGVKRTDSVFSVLPAGSPVKPLALLTDPPRALPDPIRQSVAHFLSGDARTTVIELLPRGRASDDSSRTLVEQARSVTAHVDQPGWHVSVGGETAEGIDSNEVIQSHLPLVVGLMLIAVFLLLFVTFRSLLLPFKAVVMNIISLGATYGVLVLVFQKGIAPNFLGLEKTGYLQNFVPILLLALLFSLSTDYEVFLLNRVRENYQQSRDNTESVAAAMATTAPLISGAAILMVAAFGGFAFTGLVPIQQLGFGLAIAVLIDATIVRLVLVPAAMRLAGPWNWWLPGQRQS